jgi:hypothetical protein
MPDRSASDWLHTLEGEASHGADALRSSAAKMRQEADRLEVQAAWHDERASWARAAIQALEAAQREA